MLGQAPPPIRCSVRLAMRVGRPLCWTQSQKWLSSSCTTSGTSPTLEAYIGYINRTQLRHIISLEAPVEIVDGHRMALVRQRELGTHTKSFARALDLSLVEKTGFAVLSPRRVS